MDTDSLSSELSNKITMSTLCLKKIKQKFTAPNKNQLELVPTVMIDDLDKSWVKAEPNFDK
jgi:hypothetical protein